MRKKIEQEDLIETWQFKSFNTRSINNQIVNDFFADTDSVEIQQKKGRKALRPCYVNSVEFNKILDDLYPTLNTFNEKTYCFYFNIDYNNNACYECGGHTGFINWSEGFKSTCCYTKKVEQNKIDKVTKVTKICPVCQKHFETNLKLNSDVCSIKCGKQRWMSEKPEEVEQWKENRRYTFNNKKLQ